jgi:hypothetical protein
VGNLRVGVAWEAGSENRVSWEGCMGLDCREKLRDASLSDFSHFLESFGR